MTLNEAIRLVLSERALCRVVDDEAVILDLESGQYYGLNAVGTRIWQLLGEHRQIAAVCDALVAEYEVTQDQARADVFEFIEELTTKGLIESVSGD